MFLLQKRFVHKKGAMGLVENNMHTLPTSLQRNIFVYYSVAAIYMLSISLPHAILTPLLIQKGLSFADIATIQVAFSIAVAFCARSLVAFSLMHFREELSIYGQSF